VNHIFIAMKTTNTKIEQTAFLFLLMAITVILSSSKMTTDQDVQKPAKEGWVSMFNGVNLDGWKVKIKGHAFGENWKNTFRVKDGKMVVDYSEYDKFDSYFGHIFYKSPYSSYRMKLQYRFVGAQVPGGPGWARRNSGVMIHCQDPETMELDQDFPISLEVQLLGGIEEGKKRTTGNLCTPGTHVNIDGKLVKDHCINSSSDTYYGEQWVDMEIEVRRDSIIAHSINGKEVIRYAKPIIGGQFNENAAWEGQELQGGYISLQSESHPIEFKNIQIKVIED
jgi:hypothetical protein